MDMNRAAPAEVRPRKGLFLAGMVIYGIGIFVGAGLLLGWPNLRVLLIALIVLIVVPPLIVRSCYLSVRQGLPPWPLADSTRSTVADVTLEEASELVAATVVALGKVERNLAPSSNERTIKVRTPASGLSWGEHVSVRLVRQAHHQTVVEVKSRPVMRANVFDGGRNAANVNLVMRALRAAN